MPFVCCRSKKEEEEEFAQACGRQDQRTMASPVSAAGAAAAGGAAAAAAASKGQHHLGLGGAALESPRDVLEGPAWSEYQSELLEDLQQPTGGMASPYPAMLPLDPADVDAYSPLNCSSTLNCTASSYFDAEGCLQQQQQHQQLPTRLGFGLGAGMGMGGGLGLGMASPSASSSCSVDLRGIKVTNKEVIQNAMEVLGVNGLLQFVELWDRSRRRIQEEQEHQQQQPVVSAGWDVHQLPPPWPVGHPLADGMQLLPPLLPFGGLDEQPAFSFGDNSHMFDSQQAQPQQPAATLEDDKSTVLLNFPANKCLRLSTQPAAPGAGDLPCPDNRAAKFVNTTSFGPLTPRTPSPALPASVPLELLGPCLVPQQPDVPSFVPVAQTGPATVKSGFDDKLQLQQQLNSRRTRLQLQLQQQQQQKQQQQQQQQQQRVQPVKSTPAATTRAARKHRMARQRHSHAFLHHHHLRGSTNSAANTSPAVSATASSVTSISENMITSEASNASSLTHARQPVPAPSRADPARNVQSKHGRNMDGLQFLFQKELKPSDVGSLGRIILPKREAESQLPALNMKDGMPILAEDFDTGKAWTLKYRYWPNNKSRMYVLECTGEFVKINRLEEGDLMILYRCTSGRSKYVLRGKKRTHGSEVINSKGAGGACETPAVAKSRSVLLADPTVIRSGPEDEFLQELTEDPTFEWGGLATLERFPSLEAGDLSIDEILGLGD